MCVFENRFRIKHRPKDISTSLSLAQCYGFVFRFSVSFLSYCFSGILFIHTVNTMIVILPHNLNGRFICKWICFVLEIVSFIGEISTCIRKMEQAPCTFNCFEKRIRQNFSFFIFFTFSPFFLFSCFVLFVCFRFFRSYENVLHIKKNQIVATSILKHLPLAPSNSISNLCNNGVLPN